MQVLNNIYKGLNTTFNRTFIVKQGEIEKYMNNIEGRIQMYDKSRSKPVWCQCKPRPQKQEAKLPLQFTTGVSQLHMNMTDLQSILQKRQMHRNSGIQQVGESVLKTPTDPSFDPSQDFICQESVQVQSIDQSLEESNKKAALLSLNESLVDNKMRGGDHL